MKFKSLLLVAAIGLVLVSCKKKEFDSDTQTATDYAFAKMGYNTVLPVANNITVNEEGVNKTSLYTCATVTLMSGDTTNWPANGDTIVYEVNYGTTGCTDHDGRLKKGKMTVTFYNDFKLAGGHMLVVPNNYFVDGIKYDGNIDLTNNGSYSYTRIITNGVCTGNGWVILYNGTTTLTWTSGFTTPSVPTDDSYSFSENSTGTNRNGKTFTVSTSSPLVKNSSCKWISSGVVNITPDGLATRSVDFGDGTCDNRASMTIEGRVFEFQMN